MQGDTALAGKNYKKVYRFDIIETPGVEMLPPYQLNPPPYLFGLVREDTGKVYATTFYPVSECPLNSEFLLFDFTYQIGDTIDLCVHYETFDSIRAIDYLPTYDRYALQTANSHYYIHGIGSSAGLFEAVSMSLSLTQPFLVSYCIGGLADCNIFPTGILDQSAPEKCTNLHFNAATNSLQIEQLSQQQTELQLFNTTGSLVGEYQLNGQSEIKINAPAGLYIMQAIKDDGSRCVIKISKAG